MRLQLVKAVAAALGVSGAEEAVRSRMLEVVDQGGAPRGSGVTPDTDVATALGSMASHMCRRCRIFNCLQHQGPHPKSVLFPALPLGCPATLPVVSSSPVKPCVCACRDASLQSRMPLHAVRQQQCASVTGARRSNSEQCTRCRPHRQMPKLLPLPSDAPPCGPACYKLFEGAAQPPAASPAALAPTANPAAVVDPSASTPAAENGTADETGPSAIGAVSVSDTGAPGCSQADAAANGTASNAAQKRAFQSDGSPAPQPAAKRARSASRCVPLYV